MAKDVGANKVVVASCAPPIRCVHDPYFTAMDL
jgi:glutamine phosphoribosylpyrophosphate amidotransferase